MALTFPKPLFHMELDIGGFERAAWRLPPETRILQLDAEQSLKDIQWDEWDVVTKPYPIPLQLERLIGAQQQGVTIRFPRRMVGYKPLWEKIVVDFVDAVQSPAVKTIVTDSATKEWEICHRSVLQDKQDIQLVSGKIKESDSNFRERLQPVEYPNEKMHSVIYTAKSFGKNLVLIHYPADEYKEKVTDRGVESYTTGNKIPDGFKKTREAATVVIWTYLDKENIPRAKIDDNPLTKKCSIAGMGVRAIGLELPEPSYQGLMDLQEMLQGG